MIYMYIAQDVEKVTKINFLGPSTYITVPFFPSKLQEREELQPFYN